MSVYTNFIALAKRLIAKYGTLVTWQVMQDDKTFASHTVYIVFKATEGAEAFTRFVQGSDMSIGNSDAFLAAQPWTPTINDRILRNDGTKFSLKSITPVKPGNEIVVYKLEFND
jgi:hypothetical protein